MPKLKQILNHNRQVKAARIKAAALALGMNTHAIVQSCKVDAKSNSADLQVKTIAPGNLVYKITVPLKKGVTQKDVATGSRIMISITGSTASYVKTLSPGNKIKNLNRTNVESHKDDGKEAFQKLVSIINRENKEKATLKGEIQSLIYQQDNGKITSAACFNRIHNLVSKRGLKITHDNFIKVIDVATKIDNQIIEKVRILFQQNGVNV